MSVQLGVREFKAGFFNKELISRQADKGHARYQTKMGAFIRRQMKGLIRYSKKSSTPGSPPKAHKTSGFSRVKRGSDGIVKRQQQSPLRELIFFAYDPSTRSTVIGPAKFGSTKAAQVLEHGGNAVVREPILRAKATRPTSRKQASAYKRLLKDGRLTAPRRQFRQRTITVLPRPYSKRAGDEVMASDRNKAALKGVIN